MRHPLTSFDIYRIYLVLSLFKLVLELNACELFTLQGVLLAHFQPGLYHSASSGLR